MGIPFSGSLRRKFPRAKRKRNQQLFNLTPGSEFLSFVGYLNLSFDTFRNLRKDDRIYVDKTDLVFSMVQNQSRVFLTRPRRFGKSLLVSTLEALFGRGLEDFQGLKIAKL